MDVIKLVVKQEVLKLLNETNSSLTISDLKDSDNLEALGMSSVDWSRLLAILEIKLGLRPFSTIIDIIDVSSLGELISIYAKDTAIPIRQDEQKINIDAVGRAATRKEARNRRGQEKATKTIQDLNKTL